MYKRILLIVCLSAWLNLPARAAEPSFDQWADQFAAEWARAHPQWATMCQYFDGAEQDQVDRRLVLERGVKAAHQFATLARRGLNELNRFSERQLSPSQRTSAAVIRWDCEKVMKGEEFARYQFVFDQFRGQHTALVQFLTTIHPMRDGRDGENYLARLSQLAAILDEGIAEAKAAEDEGILPPQFILQRSIKQIDTFAAPPPGSNVLVTTFAERLAILGDKVTETQRGELTAAAEKAVRETVLSAYGRVRAHLESQLPKASDDAGVWRLPRGEAAYRHALSVSTTTSLSPDEIHDIGLHEVARLEAEMDGILQQLGYKEGALQLRMDKLAASLPTPPGNDLREALLKQVADVIRDAERRSAAVFDLRPKAPVTVRRVPEMTEKTAAAHYTPPAPDGSQPGIYWLPLPQMNLKSLWVGPGLKTTAYHEAIPGHHFQVALQQETPDLPRCRKRLLFGFNSAYGEGWALYAERLADENGWYEGDLVGRLGYLNGQLFRAKRLVVDTGLHAKKWTRQQVVEYGIPEQEAERYIVWPGQACSYMIGQRRILELRMKAEQTLDGKFSIREFHNVILRVGCVPLDVLAQEIDAWVANKLLAR